MFRYLPLALAAGLASAVLYASALTGSVFGIVLAYFAMLPLFAVGLSLGFQAAGLAAVVATVAIVVFGGPLPGLIYGISHAAPSAIMTALALRSRTWTDGQVYWYPPGRLLAGIVLWCVGLLLLAGLALFVLGDGLSAGVQSFLQSMMQGLEPDGSEVVNPAALSQMAMVLPAIVAWSWMIMITINGLMAQSILRRIGRAIRPSAKMAEIEVGQTWIGVFALCVLVGMLVSGDVGFGALNVAIVMAYPLFFQGLSVVHGLLHYWGAGPVALGLFYVLLILMGWLAFLVIALGLAEPFVRLRSRFAGRRNT